MGEKAVSRFLRSRASVAIPTQRGAAQYLCAAWRGRQAVAQIGAVALTSRSAATRSSVAARGETLTLPLSLCEVETAPFLLLDK